VVRAAVSPTAIAATAAGVAIGLFLVHSVLVAVILGAGAWLARMAVFALLRSLPVAAPDQVDPWAVPEPWRQYVRQAQAAGERFDRTMAAWPAGPLRDRVGLAQPRIWQGVREIWSVAKQGAAGGGSNRPPPAALSAELRQVQAERRALDGDARDRDESLGRREEAIAAQLRAARRSGDIDSQVQDRLRLLTARLDEAVTDVLELGLDRTDVDAVLGTVDGLVDELRSLHQGMQEATGEDAVSPPAPPGLPPGPPSSPTTS
jgi:hypothetical protein